MGRVKRWRVPHRPSCATATIDLPAPLTFFDPHRDVSRVPRTLVVAPEVTATSSVATASSFTTTSSGHVEGREVVVVRITTFASAAASSTWHRRRDVERLTFQKVFHLRCRAAGIHPDQACGPRHILRAAVTETENVGKESPGREKTLTEKRGSLARSDTGRARHLIVSPCGRPPRAPRSRPLLRDQLRRRFPNRRLRCPRPMRRIGGRAALSWREGASVRAKRRENHDHALTHKS